MSRELSLEREEQMPGGNETILLVDDEEAISDVGKDMLERFGYTAITAESGERAIEIYKFERDRIALTGNLFLSFYLMRNMLNIYMINRVKMKKRSISPMKLLSCMPLKEKVLSGHGVNIRNYLKKKLQAG